eukprot:CAMPEP_0173100240 /NCGR_PEP_ID=MMETSP1102-20130122/36077_1 /TAXON_ID=49646 /ORGANISM="Geminigera sp., Strain Caron Lab Isolate" /LENGTH=123 /DNA_ID=CAMNT_0013993627 /DNA_START=308 /DNA_END=676 /DNA_ORIENTATION=+
MQGNGEGEEGGEVIDEALLEEDLVKGLHKLFVAHRLQVMHGLSSRLRHSSGAIVKAVHHELVPHLLQHAPVEWHDHDPLSRLSSHSSPRQHTATHRVFSMRTPRGSVEADGEDDISILSGYGN